MSIRSDLDELIDWYEVHQPHVVGRVIPVVASESSIAHFARKNGIRRGPYIYRNCEIIPIRRAGRRRAAHNKDEVQQP